MWKYEEQEEKTIITPPKSINYDTQEDFKKIIRSIVESGKCRTVINMDKAIYIDSSGLGMFVKAAADLRTAGGDLRLANVNSGISDILKVTSLNKVFKVFGNIESALKSYD